MNFTSLKPRSVIWIVFVVVVFLAAINMMSVAFSKFGAETAQSVLDATSNPFIGLFIGLLMTAIIQSSSTSTTMTVAAVASGSITFEHALPIIMGANIGTTLTSTIVALSYITKKEEFERAIAAGTVHDIYNIICVVLLFPLEYYFDVLSATSKFITDIFYFSSGVDSAGKIGGMSVLVFEPFSLAILDFSGSAFVLLALSFALILGCIKLLSNFLYNNIATNIEAHVDEYILPNRFKSFTIGMVVTAIVQSSSLTTSLVVPIVATGKIGVKRAFQFIMGANVGTTITALIAAAFRSEAAVSIAVAHLVFNVIGCIIFLPSLRFQSLIVYLAERLGSLTAKYRIVGFIYIIVVFFMIPFALIYFNRTI